jgi:hypothetical protein
LEEGFSDDVQDQKLKRLLGCPQGFEPDMLIQSQISPSESKEDKDLHSANAIKRE